MSESHKVFKVTMMNEDLSKNGIERYKPTYSTKTGNIILNDLSLDEIVYETENVDVMCAFIEGLILGRTTLG